MHPIKSHRDFANQRMEQERMKKLRNFTLVDQDDPVTEKKGLVLDFATFAFISWVFVFIFSIYSLSFFHLSEIIKPVIEEEGFLSGLLSSNDFQKKLFLFSLLFEVVFFPLAAWVYVKFWRVIISFFASLFDKQVEAEGLDEVVNTSLVGNFFLVIPILGKLFKSISQIFYIFLGLKHNLKFTTIQSFIVVISPLIFVGMFIIFMAMYIMLIVNLY
ncbi:hypothetical protein M901_2458 [Bacteriovorax sp. DB6_IX]|nr:hypothetical protein M901_2458 [Bacteriovorax sp. DB6_IX]